MPSLLLQAMAIFVRPAHGGQLGRKQFLEYQVAFLQDLHFDHVRPDERHAADVGRTPAKTPQHTRTGIDAEYSHGLDGALFSAPSPTVGGYADSSGTDEKGQVGSAGLDGMRIAISDCGGLNREGL